MKTFDSAWLDGQYNNRELVRDYAAHFRRWTADSIEVIRGGGRELDVRYGGGPNEHLDIFHAHRDQHAPVLFFIHGGYWRSMDKREHAFVAPPFTQQGSGTATLPDSSHHSGGAPDNQYGDPASAPAGEPADSAPAPTPAPAAGEPSQPASPSPTPGS